MVENTDECELGFIFYHSTEEVEVVQLNEIRKGHVYFLEENKTSM